MSLYSRRGDGKRDRVKPKSVAWWRQLYYNITYYGYPVADRRRAKRTYIYNNNNIQQRYVQYTILLLYDRRWLIEYYRISSRIRSGCASWREMRCVRAANAIKLTRADRQRGHTSRIHF